MIRNFFGHWRGNFLTGLVVLLPFLITVALGKWLFGTISSVTDALLFFLPQTWTHADDGRGAVLWHWSLVALVFAVVLLAAFGQLARYYIGLRILAWLDRIMLQIPLLNKIYGTIKQIKEALGSNTKTAFKQVVMVEFPREGMRSIGFVTNDQHGELQAKTAERVICVFIPTTPNPTSGFLVLVPEDKVVKLDMSVPEAIKFIVSLGAVAPEYPGGAGRAHP